MIKDFILFLKRSRIGAPQPQEEQVIDTRTNQPTLSDTKQAAYEQGPTCRLLGP